MTPEQREELKQAALKIYKSNYSDPMTVREDFNRKSSPEAILSLIAQVEALNRKNLELQRVHDERGLQIERLEVALQRAHEAKIETQPAHEEIIRTGSMLMCTACGTISKEPAWEKLPEVYFDEDAALLHSRYTGNEGGSVSRDSEKFWRENQRPGTTLFGHYRPRTLWQRFYDWCTGRPKPPEE